MKNNEYQDLIGKIENIDLPKIELTDHRERLRDFLVSGLARRQPEADFPSSLRAVSGRVAGFLVKGISSKQPVWKIVSFSAFVMAVALIVVLAFPRVSTDSAYARAIDIVQNSPEIQAVTGNATIRNIKVLVDDDNKITLRFTSGLNLYTTEVNLESGRVVYVSSWPELTEEEKQKVIRIAEADPRIKELLGEGARILRITPRHYDYTIEEEIVILVIESDEDVWFAYIGPDEKRIFRFSKLE